MKGSIFVVSQGNLISVEYDGNDDLKKKLSFFSEHADEFRPALDAILRNSVALLTPAMAAINEERQKLAKGMNMGDRPECPEHGPMRKSDKPGGGWYCPNKLPNGKWCPQKVK